jgi:hemolysin activation/secretion protein
LLFKRDIHRHWGPVDGDGVLVGFKAAVYLVIAVCGWSAPVLAYPIPVLDDDFNLSFTGLAAPDQEEAGSAAAVRAAVPVAPSCVEVQTVTFTGAEIFPSQALLEGFEPGCRAVADLFDLVGVITNRYVAAGYVTSNAFLPEQDLSSGTLEIVVVEGRVETVVLIEDGAERATGGTVMPHVRGKVLNLRTIEQGLDQINGLRSKDATISFRPGSRPGWSVVEVDITARPGWEVSSQLSNSANGASDFPAAGPGGAPDRLRGRI